MALALAFTFAPTPVLAAKATASKPDSAQHSIDVDAFNATTQTPLLKTGSRGPAVVRAQILLDRAWFSSGEIDGRFGSNLQRIVKAYQLSQGLKGTGTLTPQTWQALREGSAELPFLTHYTITDDDAAGPFEKTPSDPEARRVLKAMPYESIEEALAERFHTSAAYLKQINKAVRFEAGSQIVVPNVLDGKPPVDAASIEIDKTARVLYVLATDKRPLAAFPISIGNEDSDPLPIGAMTIKNEVKNPSFTFDPALLKNQPEEATKMELPPGPNNPVGNIWLGLSKPHWGIHGTPEPGNVGHSETNGCIHLTNWDAARVSLLVQAGFEVDVRP